MILSRIEVVRDHVVEMEIDAIVTFADEQLKSREGAVDREVHRAAGPRLKRACRRLLGCEAGKAKISRGYNLPARHVIHTVAPREHDESDLASCYRSSLELAAKHELQSIAFPIPGSEALPVEREVEIALDEIARFLAEHEEFERVVVCCDDHDGYHYSRLTLESLPQ